MKRLKKLGLLMGIMALALVLLAACGGGKTNEPTPPPSEQPVPEEQPTPEEGAAPEEGTTDTDLVATGEEVAKKSCIGCHGADLQGQGSFPSLHNLDLSKEEIIEVLEKGRGSMPPGLASGNEEAVAEYLLTLK